MEGSFAAFGNGANLSELQMCLTVNVRLISIYNNLKEMFLKFNNKRTR